MKGAERLVSDQTQKRKLIASLSAAEAAARSLELVRAGYNPICLFDGERAEVQPDFLVSHRLSEERPSAAAWVVIPLLPPLRKALTALGRDLPKQPSAGPAPKIWARDGDTVVEYSIFLGGGLGFELIRETAHTIGVTNPEPLEKSDGG